MKKGIALLLVSVLAFSTLCMTAFAKEESKIGYGLRDMVLTDDPDTVVTVRVLLKGSAEYTKMPSWPDREQAVEEARLLIAERAQQMLDEIPEDVEYTVEAIYEQAPIIRMKLKLKDVPTIAQMDQVSSVLLPTTEDYLNQIIEPEGTKYYKKFFYWANETQQPFYYRNDEYVMPPKEDYRELYEHHADGTDEDDWALIHIAAIITPPWKQGWRLDFGDRVIEGIVGASNGTQAYPYFIYDAEKDIFYNIYAISPDRYDGLLNALRELKIGRPWGDVDDNGELEIIDATLIQRKLTELDSYDDETDRFWYNPLLRDDSDRGWCYYSDIDRDGETTILDATRIQRVLVGLN